MVCVVAPVLHWYVLNPEVAVRLAVEPMQGVKLPEILGAGFATTVTALVADDEQPNVLVTVTV